MPRPSFDWTNIRKNRLTGLRKLEKSPAKWLWQCDCGNQTVALASNVRKGHTASCGCKKTEYINYKKTLDSRIEKTCEQCFKIFKDYVRKRKNEGRFCSNECKYSYLNKGSIEFVCISCGSKFTKKSSRLKYDKNSFCTRACMYEYRVGDKHPQYKGGNIDGSGYRRIYVDKKMILEHRHIVEVSIGRRLLPEEHVHHLDENKLNNNIENLVIVSNSEHQKIYHPRNLTKIRMEKRQSS